MTIPTLSQLSGVWVRSINYEPREEVADSAARDGSVVVWAQSPCGAYVDVRRVAGENLVVRGFAGTAHVDAADEEDQSAFRVNWDRHVDTQPSSCPSGIDSATCRLVGGFETCSGVGVVLLEEGDGYLEVWRRVAVWDRLQDKVVKAEKHEIMLSVAGYKFGATNAPIASVYVCPGDSGNGTCSSLEIVGSGLDSRVMQ
eukprot:CFRG6378T1